MFKLKSDIKERLYQESIFEIKNKINEINKFSESKKNGENPTFDFKCLTTFKENNKSSSYFVNIPVSELTSTGLGSVETVP